MQALVVAFLDSLFYYYLVCCHCAHCNIEKEKTDSEIMKCFLYSILLQENLYTKCFGKTFENDNLHLSQLSSALPVQLNIHIQHLQVETFIILIYTL